MNPKTKILTDLFTKQKETHRLEKLTYGCQGKRMKGSDMQGIWGRLYSPPHLKWIINKGLLNSTGNSTECYMAAWMGGECVGTWIHTYMCMAKFLCCSPEAITTLLTGYTPIWNKKLKNADLTKQKTQWAKKKDQLKLSNQRRKRMQKKKENLQELWMPLGETRYPRCLLSCVWLFATTWTVAAQAPLSMGFSRPEYWSGLPCPPPGDLPSPRMEPKFPGL